MTDPPDTDPNSEANCIQTCEEECPGGVGIICGEVFPFQVGASMVYTKICTCVCPVEKCPKPTPNMSTTAKPIINKITHIVLYKNPYLKLLKFKNVLIGVKLIFELCIILGLFFLKLILLAILYFILSQFFDVDLGLFPLLLQLLTGSTDNNDTT